MENCCRTCLKEKRFNSMKLLSTKWNDTVLSFADMLVDFVIMNKEITSDETAFRICSSCESDLITAYNFKIVCQKTEKVLAERLTKNIFELPPIEEIKCETIIEDVLNNLDENSTNLLDDDFSNLDENDSKDLIGQYGEQQPIPEIKKSKKRKIQSTPRIRKNKEDVKDKKIKLNPSINNIDQETNAMKSDMLHTDNERDNSNIEKREAKNQIKNCGKCNISFESEKLYRKHLRQIHKNDKKKTNALNRMNNENSSGIKLEDKIRKPNTYCRQCDMRFEEQKLYRKHRRELHSNPMSENIKERRKKNRKPSLYCRKCDLRFEAEKFYRKHCQETHWQSVACTICGKLFLESRIKSHMEIHQPEKTHICNHCGAKFLSNTNLREHLRIHTGEKRYKCDYCGETFIHWNSRKNHIVLVHTKEKKYECYICHRKFAQNSGMKSHIRYHTGDLPHPCPFCVDKRFPTAKKLKAHLLTQMHKNVPVEEKEIYMNV